MELQFEHRFDLAPLAPPPRRLEHLLSLFQLQVLATIIRTQPKLRRDLNRKPPRLTGAPADLADTSPFPGDHRFKCKPNGPTLQP